MTDLHNTAIGLKSGEHRGDGVVAGEHQSLGLERLLDFPRPEDPGGALLQELRDCILVRQGSEPRLPHEPVAVVEERRELLTQLG